MRSAVHRITDTRFVRSRRRSLARRGVRALRGAWTTVAMAGAAAEASVAVEATPAVVAESTPASTREGGDPPPRAADETRRSVDARDVVSFLLEREHLAAAFELFQDVVESTSAWHGAPAERVDADAARLEEARDTLERYFGDQERFPVNDLRAYAEQVDVPLLQASVREQESRARVAEYDAELAAEDLQRARLELEAAELERQAAEKRRGAAGTSESRGDDNNAAAFAFSLSSRAFADPDVESVESDTSVSASEPAFLPLPPPSDSERRVLNALVADYLDRRGYRATRLTLRDEACDGFSDVFLKTEIDENGKSRDRSIAAAADGLRRAVHRASRLDARDAAYEELLKTSVVHRERIQTLERALAAKEAETVSLGDGVARLEASVSEWRRKGDALESRLEEALRSIASLETARVALQRDFERADATAKHLERDLEGKTREFKRALAEERAERAARKSAGDENDSSPSFTTPTKSATNTTTERESTLVPRSPPVHAFEASAEEEATVRALADALPRVASATLVAKRHELLPLFARAATRHRVASVRVETLRTLFDLVKRPEPFHRDALAATAFAIARDAGEKRAIAELVPVLRSELAHKKQDRRVAACHCVAAVARALPETTRLSTCFPLLFDAFFACSSREETPRRGERLDENKKENESKTTTSSVSYTAYTSEDASSSSSSFCPETRLASLRAFAAACDCSSACSDSASANAAESFVAAALEDTSEHVSECAAEVAAPAMTRWRVRANFCKNGADGDATPVAFLESFAKGRVSARVAEALATFLRAEGGHDADFFRFRARFYLRLFARTLETFRDEALLRRETNVPENENLFTTADKKNDAAARDEPSVAFAAPVARWFASNASDLVHALVLSVPKDDADATLRRDAARATKALCVAAGETVARDVIVPALTSAAADPAFATPVALAAALPLCGPGALETFVREYVEREAKRTDNDLREANRSEDVDDIAAYEYSREDATADVAVRRAVALCSEELFFPRLDSETYALASSDNLRPRFLDDPPADVVPDEGAGVRDAITRVLEAVAGETAREEGADKNRAPTKAALLATTLLGSAAAAGPASAAARVLPALSRLAAGPASVAARAAAALVRVGDAHAEDGDADESGSEADPSANTKNKKEDVALEALRRLDDALARRDALVAAAFCSAARDAATFSKREGSRSFSYGGEGFKKSRRDAFWDGVASRVAAVTVAFFASGDESFSRDSLPVRVPTNDSILTRRRLASLCFGAARGILEAEDDEAIRDDTRRNGTASSAVVLERNDSSSRGATGKSAPRRDALATALRALVVASEPDSRTGTASRLLDASDGALAEAMLRDEDWRLVAAAEAAAMEAKGNFAAGLGSNPATIKTRRSTLSYAPSVSVPSASEMRRAMFGGSKRTNVASSEPFLTRANDKSVVASSASNVSTVAVANEEEDSTDPSSPAAPSIDFATLVGEAAPVVATSDVATADVSETLVAPEKDAPKETGKRSATSTSMSSKMFSAMPSAPKMAKMPSLPKNPFGK